MYRMLLDVFRFNLFGLDLVTDSAAQRKDGAKGGPTSGETGQSKGMDVDEVDEREVSIGEYLEREGYGEGFKEDYLLVSCSLSITKTETDRPQPMTAAMYVPPNTQNNTLTTPQLVNPSRQMRPRLSRAHPRSILPQPPPHASRRTS